MALRALVAFVLLLLAHAAHAERWQTTAVPKRAGLPVVRVAVGYPTAYVPMDNAPIELRMTAGSQSFDGYIGFHIAVGKNETLDVPVTTRVVLAPRATASISTTFRLGREYDRRLGGHPDPSTRELVIEWRDRSLSLLEDVSAGVPPWGQRLPLRVVDQDVPPVRMDTLGDAAVALPSRALPPDPQWYAGFSTLAIPVRLWFALSPAVRDAIFRSAIYVVFAGVPDRIPALNAIDRALLPVEFRDQEGVSSVPWPYAETGTTMTTPVSWRPKPGSRFIGASELPFITRSAIAAHVGSVAGLSLALPGMTAYGVGAPRHGELPRKLSPTIRELAREYRLFLLTLVVIAAAIVLWIAVRRMPRPIAIAAAIAFPLLVLANRESIHPVHGAYVEESTIIVSPGVIVRERSTDVFGPSPALPGADHLRALTADRREIPAWVKIVAPKTPAGEVVKSPPVATLVVPRQSWVSDSRVSHSQELATPATFHVVSRDEEKIVFDYSSSVPMEMASASWVANGLSRYGEAHLDSPYRGRVTVRHREHVWTDLGTMRWAGSTGLNLRLIRADRDSMRSIDSHEADAPKGSFSIGVPMRKGPGEISGVVAFPGGQVPRGTMVYVGDINNLRFARFEGPGGMIMAERVQRPHAPGVAFAVSGESLQRVVSAEGVVRLVVDPTEDRRMVWLVVRENKP